MGSLETRLSRLEEQLPDEDSAFEQFCRCLPHLDENGNLAWVDAQPVLLEVFGPWLRNLGAKHSRECRRLHDDLERGLAHFLDVFTQDSKDIFVSIERFRGRIPDRVLAEIYNQRRNWFSGDSLRIRQLAGVVDESGRPFPGYVLHDNGCITDEPVPTRESSDFQH